MKNIKGTFTQEPEKGWAVNCSRVIAMERLYFQQAQF